jgi:energy-coupling factor transport system ATP-binding protein
VLALDTVSYRYAGALRPSLTAVSLSVGDGQVVGLAGRNEAGKSTLCLVASGLAPRVIGGDLTGQLLIDGEDAAPLLMHEFASRVAIAFQNPATQLSGVTTTVYEEVAFGPANLGVPRAQLVERVESALAALRIEELAPRDPRRLSGGQQQLVAIAGLLAMRPRHLVLDEPTAELDPAGTALVEAALAGLAEDGASILLAEHKTDLLARLCQRIVILGDGHLLREGPASEVLTDPELDRYGIAAPSGVRLRRLAAEAGLKPERLGVEGLTVPT